MGRIRHGTRLRCRLGRLFTSEGIGRRAHTYFQPTFSSVTVSSSSMLLRTCDPLSAWPRCSWCVPQRGLSESALGNIEPSRVYLL